MGRAARTTFRRHVPDISRELSASRRAPTPDHPDSPDARRYLTLQERTARLSQDNKALTDHLELAIANIMRLTLENHQLRQELETATQIRKIEPNRLPR